jgi:ribonuclease T1
MFKKGFFMWRNSGGGWRHALTVALLVLASAASAPAWSRNSPAADAKTADTTIAVAQLPVQGRDVLTLIDKGGPFRHDKDGTVFGNRERLLPLQPRGFYREYTVRTPGVSHRGARRIVCGGLKPIQPEACFYTEDHYASFRRIIR